MIAVCVCADLVLAGVCVPAHRTLEVVEDVPPCEGDEERTVLSAAEARALIRAGYAEPIEADFGELAELLDEWQRT